jgi:hypothetical protein
LQRLEYYFDDRVGVLQDIEIVESQYMDPEFVEMRRPSLVVGDSFRFMVLAPVHLDGKPSLMTVEVDDEWTDGMLPAELGGHHRPISEERPQPILSV